MRIATCLALLLTLPVRAANAPAPLPAAVTNELKAVAAECSDVGGQPRTTEAIKRADLNKDGREDFVLDVGAIVCEGAASAYGDRAKGVKVFAGDGRGALKAFEDVVYGVNLQGGTLWLMVSGAQCGKPPARDFASESFCERPLTWNAAQNKFQYAPLSAIKMLQ